MVLLRGEILDGGLRPLVTEATEQDRERGLSFNYREPLRSRPPPILNSSLKPLGTKVPIDHIQGPLGHNARPNVAGNVGLNVAGNVRL